MNWHAFFTYHPETGNLICKDRDASTFLNERAHKAFRRFVGSIAGTAVDGKYKEVKVNGVSYYAHKIIWEMHNGPVPDGMMVDHAYRNKSNNLIDNLRLATRTQNNWNAARRKDSASGYRGVQKNWNQWKATIQVNGKSIYLGTFPTKELAHQAYCAAADKHHGPFAQTN